MQEEDTVETQPPETPIETPIGPDHQLPPSKRRSTGVRILVWLVILLAFGVLFWFILHHKQTAAIAPAGAGRRGAGGGPVTITVATANQGNIGVYLEAIGTVTPVYTDTITSQVTGLITQVHYREGQLVRRGTPLIQVDPRIFSAQVEQAQGALQRDTNLLAQARMDLARYQAAWARNAIPKQLLDDQEKLVLQDEGTVKADQGTLKFDQVQLAYCYITAPINGRVGLRLVDPGNVVTAGSTTALVVITQLQPITVVFTLSEDNLGQVLTPMRQGKSLEVDAYDRSNQTKLAVGKLLTVDNQIDTTTGTLKLRAIFDNRDNALFPNLFVNTRVLARTLQNVVLIPSSAIQHNGDVAFVYLIKNGEAHIQNIKTGVSDSGMTAVEGLQAGDVVANSSFEKLQNGSKIVISKQAILPSSSTSNAP